MSVGLGHFGVGLGIVMLGVWFPCMCVPAHLVYAFAEVFCKSAGVVKSIWPMRRVVSGSPSCSCSFVPQPWLCVQQSTPHVRSISISAQGCGPRTSREVLAVLFLLDMVGTPSEEVLVVASSNSSSDIQTIPTICGVMAFVVRTIAPAGNLRRIDDYLV